MGFLIHFQLINYGATYFGTWGITDERYLLKYPKLQLSVALSLKTLLASALAVTRDLAEEQGFVEQWVLFHCHLLATTRGE